MSESNRARRTLIKVWFRRRGISGDMMRKITMGTGEALLVLRRKTAVKAQPITVRGKWKGQSEGDGLGRSTEDPGAVKRRRREGPRPMRYSSLKRGRAE
jgi:hypothetical protein